MPLTTLSFKLLSVGNALSAVTLVGSGRSVELPMTKQTYVRRRGVGLRSFCLFAAVICFIMAAALTGASAQPIPKPRPDTLKTDIPDYEIANTLLRQGFQAIARKDDVELARLLVKVKNPVDRQLLTWRAMRQGRPGFSFTQIIDFQTENPDWPNQDVLATRAEHSLIGVQISAEDLISKLEGRALKTDKARIDYAVALQSVGREAEALQRIRTLWREERLSRRNEQRILAHFGDKLRQADHRARVFWLLYGRHRGEADRHLARLAKEDQALAKAWIAVLRRAKNAAALLEALPESSKKTAAYAFAQVQRLRRLGQEEQAAKVLAAAPTDAALLLNPDAWWRERRILGRDMREADNMQLAYDLVANHAAQNARWVVEAEFHAGWFALQFLSKPELAIEHFQRILTVATIPPSKARANYWLGRSYQALEEAKLAQIHTLAAAKYPTTYYGQLANAELKRADLLLPEPKVTQSDRDWFAASSLISATKRLYEVGLYEMAIPFQVALGDTAPTAGAGKLASELAQEAGDLRGALALGKRATRRFVDAQILAFPTGNLPIDIELPDGVEKALIYTVARQESAFNPEAVSPAGARGFMQVMPATARRLSRDLGLTYSRAALTDDPNYNARLGAVFLSQQLAAFDGSLILTFAAYNAGPGQTKKWIARFGDPRDPEIDPIDWVEMISFGETRDYVQKLIENLQVYRHLLDGGGPSILADLRRGQS